MSNKQRKATTTKHST